ncbi:hypothetical protein [Cytobacillus sp. NCCP-133]|uniref:hypothetical protein n=1 Tax=Cytobacillus sp. NCCP-133 TaxID=766848 RepID=UPI00222F4166|nr:hypothetical protein [Cytobacillus sp. NCCP-133]GLB60784.1 hypothetical protein NCCP133_29160 [Cytobacillus sp. NCCP-133]
MIKMTDNAVNVITKAIQNEKKDQPIDRRIVSSSVNGHWLRESAIKAVSGGAAIK